MPNWNPIQYEKFLKDRTQPAIDLANRLEGFDSNSILDLGCGPGNSTKVLIDKFPTAKIIGADNSDEMLEKARGLYPDIEFINFDANGDLSRQDDIIILRQRNTMIFFLIFQMTLKYGKQPIATVCRALIVSLNGTKAQGCVLILNSLLNLM